MADYNTPNSDDDPDIYNYTSFQRPAASRGLWKKSVEFVAAEPSHPFDALPFCKTCGTVILSKVPQWHYDSLRHKAKLPHSPVPPKVDRSRMGCKYLEKHDYDPDAGQGLGMDRQGIVSPVVAAGQNDRTGLGFVKKTLPMTKAMTPAAPVTPKPQKLDAGKMRKLVAREKKRDAKLRNEFYGNDNVKRPLGPYLF